MKACQCRILDMDNMPSNRADPKEIYLKLRNQELLGSRDRWTSLRMADPAKPWGIVMDLALQKGVCTVTAFSDGNASIYLSSGGGFIGGGQSDETIIKAAKSAVQLSSDCLPTASFTTTFPLPESGQVVFYLLTDKGVYRADVTEQELKAGRHPLVRLANAMQEVITQYRLKHPQPVTSLNNLKKLDNSSEIKQALLRRRTQQ
ncbi:MAG: hypothetical protein ABSE51_17205 [Terracidiphilus sp.]|jgi:hypothetical protein